MKTVLTKFLAFGSMGLLMLASCKKNDAIVTSNGGKSATLTASATTLPLDKTRLNDTSKVINFNFSKFNYGYSAAVTNTLQIDPAGDNWAKPMSVVLAPKVLSQGYSTTDFNNLLLKLNVAAGVPTQVNVRIQGSVGQSEPPVYSNTLSLTVTTFNLTSWIYITGAFSGWANPGPTEDSLVSVTGNGIYTGVINFNATGGGANQFLLLPAKNWLHKYATTDAGSLTPSATITYDASNNFNAPAANGWYVVTANLNNNTISFASADYYSLIGSAPPGSAWSTDTFMKYVNDGNGMWVANNIPMVAGEYKFRQDAAWGHSWGPGATDGTAVSSGAVGDGNIQLTTAGNYNFTFFMPLTDTGGSLLGSTSFTAVKQ